TAGRRRIRRCRRWQVPAGVQTQALDVLAKSRLELGHTEQAEAAAQRAVAIAERTGYASASRPVPEQHMTNYLRVREDCRRALWRRCVRADDALMSMNRRQLLAAGAGVAGLLAIGPALRASAATASRITPSILPDPASSGIDHIAVVCME